MKRTAIAVAAIAAAAALSACGSDTGDAGSSGAESGDPATSQGDTVVQVTVHQTGGLKPTDQTLVFSASGSPPSGYTEQDVETVIARANALAASGITLPRLPQTPCCDFYAYDITLTLADGDSLHFAASDGAEQPKPVELLLAAVG